MKKVILLLALFFSGCVVSDLRNAIVVQRFNEDRNAGVVAYQIDGVFTYKNRSKAIKMIDSACGWRTAKILNEEEKDNRFFKQFKISVDGRYMVIIYDCVY
jgi:hypothetical protein